MATVRTTVNLPEREYGALKALADRRDISFTHALRQAIQSELYIQSLVDSDAKLLVQTNDGGLKEIVFTQATPAGHTTPAGHGMAAGPVMAAGYGMPSGQTTASGQAAPPPGAQMH